MKDADYPAIFMFFIIIDATTQAFTGIVIAIVVL